MRNQVGHGAFLKTKQNTRTPNVPQPFRCENLTQQSPVVCNSEVIKAYEDSAWSLVSRLLPLLPPLLSSVLPRNPSCGDAAVSGSLPTKIVVLPFLTKTRKEPATELPRYCKTVGLLMLSVLQFYLLGLVTLSKNFTLMYLCCSKLW